jgi:hypothetical protein
MTYNPVQQERREKHRTELLERQGGMCAMHGGPIIGRAVLDHDSKTATSNGNVKVRIRGVLCDPCNLALGYIEKYGEMAAAYLSGFPENFQSDELSPHKAKAMTRTTAPKEF